MKHLVYTSRRLPSGVYISTHVVTNGLETIKVASKDEIVELPAENNGPIIFYFYPNVLGTTDTYFVEWFYEGQKYEERPPVRKMRLNFITCKLNGSEYVIGNLEDGQTLGSITPMKEEEK